MLNNCFVLFVIIGVFKFRHSPKPSVTVILNYFLADGSILCLIWNNQKIFNIFVPTINVCVMNKYFESIYEIIRTGHWITDSITKSLKEFGIYEPQYNVLRILRGAKGNPIAVNTILEQMVQRSSNVTRIVDKLEIKGLVERSLSLEDRRKMDISITEKGLQLLVDLDKKVANFHAPMMNNLNQEETEQLKQLIIKLRGNQVEL